MAETPDAPEPSMEEILASIRKIISSDEPPAPEPAPEPVIELPQEDVLELTQMIEEEVVIAPPAPEPAPVVEEAPPAPSFAPVEALVSAPAAQTAASALSSLANTVEIERLSSAPPAHTYLGNGSRTLEDMALELMRPLLKTWLDQNLPDVVERLVQKEIERIARRS